ncbi:hypothetical protein ACFL3X_00085 [Gemmatimonadota bacterium]
MKLIQSEHIGKIEPRARRALILLVLLAGTVILTATPDRALSQQEERASAVQDVYLQAIGLNLQGEWAQALPLFQQVAGSDSPRAAEAAFYVGLCLENIPDRDVEAFQSFAELRSRFPDDPITSKAISHQITLAGMLGTSDSFYQEFLARQIENPDLTLNREAVLSLARLGDERSIDGILKILREGTTDQKIIALERISDFETGIAVDLARQALAITTGTPLAGRARTLEQSFIAQQTQREREAALLTTDRQSLMNQIGRKGATWTDEELLTQGLYLVMSLDTFVSYLQASSRAKQRIYDEFFATRDTEPDTPQNEMEIEFRRRIEYAVEFYSEPYKAARSRFGASDWLTADNVYAPWDARGELYVKYGQPDDIFLVQFNVEEWAYSRYQVDFTVHKYKVNFYRNAIYPGRASQWDYAPGFVQTHFIDAPRFEYWPKRDE